MLQLNLLILLGLISAVTIAQQIDTLVDMPKEKDSVLNRLRNRAESSQRQYAKKLDSLQSFASISRFKDSLKISSWSDSLRRKVENRFSSQQIAGKLDSLRAMSISTDRMDHFSDSLMRRKDLLLSEVGEKQQTLQKKVTGRYDDWMKGAREKFNLDSAGIRPPALDPALNDPLKNLNVPNTQVDLQVGLPGVNLPSGSLQAIPSIPSLNTEDFSGLGLSGELSTVAGDLAIPTTDQLSGWDKNMPSMPDPMKDINGQLAEVKALTKDPGAVAEKAVQQVSEVSDATKALSEAEKMKNENEALKLADQVKDADALMESAQREAVDHFNGKGELLQQSMSKVSEYKKKYSSLGSLSEIKKKDWLPRNGLKGQPFKERFRIGLHAGFKNHNDTLLLDFYPNASYRITGRLEAGLGVIYRVRLNTKDFSFDQHDPVWGLSTFAIVKTFKSICIRFEVDGNSFPKTSSPDQSNYRDWRWSFHSGIQTNFKLGKQWTGNVQMLYNFERSLKDGFPERLVMRFGFQYKLATVRR